MFGAGSRTTAWFYLPPVGHIVTQPVRILVIDRFVLISTEEAHFTSWSVPPPAPPGCSWFASFRSGHLLQTPLERNILWSELTDTTFLGLFSRRGNILPVEEFYPVGDDFIPGSRLSILAFPGSQPQPAFNVNETTF